MKIIAALCLAAAALATPIPEETYQKLFGDFIAKYEKNYEMSEFFQRFNTFKSNLDLIRAHNAEEGHTYTLAMNQFGDLEQAEYSSQMLGYKNSPMDYLRSRNAPQLNNTAPDSIDWVSKGAVTPVKNQGQCGSCWAFSTTGSTEGANFIKNGKLESLSEQQLVDCSASEGNNGCNGGLMDYGFEYIIKTGGLCLESDYSYKGRKSLFCKKSSCTSTHAPITGYSDVTSQDEAELKKAVALGPVSIAVEADKSAFQFYSGGVLTSSACGTKLDHGVLIVGYGTEDGTAYWKVKNSWGPSWGDEGYLKIKRNTDGTKGKGVCGIAMQPSYPKF